MSSVVYKKKKANTNVEYEILESGFDNNLKKDLLRISRLELFDKRSFPHLVIVSPYNSGEDKVLDIYKHIVQEKCVFGRDCGCIKLTFPGPEQEENCFDKFFKSPRISATTSNDFNGVFAIDFTEWKCEELLKNKHFEKLMEYVVGKRDIQFVFTIYDDDDQLKINELVGNIKEHLNIFDIRISRLTLEDSYIYVYKKLQANGLSICKKGNAYTYLKKHILAPNISRDRFLGYQDLDRIVDIILFEAAIYNSTVGSINEENALEFLKKIREVLILKDNKEDSKVKMGFSI